MTIRDEAIEAMAKEIWRAKYPNKSETGTSWEDWARFAAENPGKFDGRDTCRTLATAALDALIRVVREPDKAMITAAQGVGLSEIDGIGQEYPMSQNLSDEDAAAIWQAMLGKLEG